MIKHQILDQSFYKRNTVLAAQELLGKMLIRIVDNQLLAGIIIETEAYTNDDPACHAFRGKTKSNQALFGPVGHAYVYFTYGMHHCINVVAYDEPHKAGGVLIRALEPLEGISIMHKNRGMKNMRDLTNGPGKVAQALQLNRDFNGHNLTMSSSLYIVDTDNVSAKNIFATPRIGISKAQDVLWRFTYSS